MYTRPRLIGLGLIAAVLAAPEGGPLRQRRDRGAHHRPLDLVVRPPRPHWCSARGVASVPDHITQDRVYDELRAGVAELVDAAGLGPVGRESVEVRVLSPALSRGRGPRRATSARSSPGRS